MSEVRNIQLCVHDPNGEAVKITITTSATLSNTTGDGPSYAVTAISGSVDGAATDGKVGTGGVAATEYSNNYYYFTYDNAIFPTSTTGAYGSTDGIDKAGFYFSIGGVHYNLWTQNGSFILDHTGSQPETLTLVSTDAPLFLRRHDDPDRPRRRCGRVADNRRQCNHNDR